MNIQRQGGTDKPRSLFKMLFNLAEIEMMQSISQVCDATAFKRGSKIIQMKIIFIPTGCLRLECYCDMLGELTATHCVLKTTEDVISILWKLRTAINAYALLDVCACACECGLWYNIHSDFLSISSKFHAIKMEKCHNSCIVMCCYNEDFSSFGIDLN